MEHIPYLYAGISWHFSWMGDIQKKIQSFAHVEFNCPDITHPNAIAKAVEEGKDVLGRQCISYQVQPMSSFPDDLRLILEQYPHLIK
jgi:hypothetical protein